MPFEFNIKELQRRLPSIYDEYLIQYNRAALMEELDSKLTQPTVGLFVRLHPELLERTDTQIAKAVVATQRSAKEHARMVHTIQDMLREPGFIETAQDYAANFVNMGEAYPTKEVMIEAANDLTVLANAYDTVYSKFHADENYRAAVMLLIKNYYGKEGDVMIHKLYSPDDMKEHADLF